MSSIPEPTGLIEVRVDPKLEIIETLQNQLHTLNIKRAAIVSVVGTTNNCRLITRPRKNVKSDIYTDIKEDGDLSGNGDVRDGKPNIRIMVTCEGGRLFTGQLHNARAATTTSIYILPMT